MYNRLYVTVLKKRGEGSRRFEQSRSSETKMKKCLDQKERQYDWTGSKNKRKKENVFIFALF